MRMESLVAHNGCHAPDAIALVCAEMRLSHSALDDLSSRLAAQLMLRGAGPGDRIVFVADNSCELVVAFYATWKLGGIACPLHPSIKPAKLADIMTSVEPAAVITQIRHVPVIKAACTLADIDPQLVVVGGPDAIEGNRAASYEALVAENIVFKPPADLSENDLALLIHTSGSTGKPKGVMLSHNNITAACGSIVDYLKNNADDVVLSILPLSFGYGITQMVTMAMVGGRLVLERSFAFPRVILSRLQSEAVTGFPLVPTMAALFAGIQDIGPEILPHLRYMTNAAAGMPPSLIEKLRRTLPHVSLFLMYGQTECLRTTYLPPEEVDRRPLSVGRAIPGTTIRIVDDAGEPVKPGEPGELVVEGPHVMRGYWRDETASAKALRPHGEGVRLHTGDLFRMDEDGFFYFLARRDDIIKTRGEKVSPQEVERVLYSLDGIREAAVEGVPDEVFGQVVKAHVAVEPQAGLTDKAILRHCAAHLEDFMVPKLVEFHDALPKTATGKIRLGIASAEADARQTEKGRTA